jgi:hypothetical protein
MNKLLFSGLMMFFLLTFSTEGVAQQRFKAAAVIGANFNQVDGDDLIGFHHLGFQGGLKVYTIFTERWEMGLSILYTQQGSKASSDDFSGNYDKLLFNMVEVPVLLHFNEWKFKLGTGFSYARLINYEVIDVTGTDISALQDYNSNIFSFIVETSVMANDHLSFNLRWSRSLSNFQANPDNGKFFSRVIGLRALYLF